MDPAAPTKEYLATYIDETHATLFDERSEEVTNPAGSDARDVLDPMGSLTRCYNRDRVVLWGVVGR